MSSLQITGGDSALGTLYITGKHPIIADPGIAHAEAWLSTGEFLAVQDRFLREPARCAGVVLPSPVRGRREWT